MLYAYKTYIVVGTGSQPVMACQLRYLKSLLCYQVDVYGQMFKANSVLCSYYTTKEVQGYCNHRAVVGQMYIRK